MDFTMDKEVKNLDVKIEQLDELITQLEEERFRQMVSIKKATIYLELLDKELHQARTNRYNSDYKRTWQESPNMNSVKYIDSNNKNHNWLEY